MNLFLDTICKLLLPGSSIACLILEETYTSMRLAKAGDYTPNILDMKWAFTKIHTAFSVDLPMICGAPAGW